MLPAAGRKNQDLVLRRLPWITFALITSNVIVFLITSQMPSEELLLKYGHIPADPYVASYFAGMFIHTGLLHLFGNMIFLYLVGCSMEELWGRPLYLCFYFSAAIVAAVIQDFTVPESELPFVGVSGAIAGLMGAFIVRLYKSKITFVYPTTKFMRGTFQLPAWVVLPLWFLQLIFLKKVLGSQADPAYMAHAGAFIFGAIFASILLFLRFEDQYINTYVERQVGVSQHAVFQQAMELSRNSEFVQATNLLKQVLAKEPDHMEAHMELRRIADLNGDDEAYRLYTGSMLEALIRKRHHDAISELYRQSQTNKVLLPARTLIAMGTFQEQIPDFRSALDVYQKLIDQNKNDPLVVKAYSKMARLCLEKFGDKRRGTELLEQAYSQTGNEEWRVILKAEFKRYGIPLPVETPPVRSDAAEVPLISSLGPSQEFHEIFSEEPSEIGLPNAIFEGQKRGWNPVNCSLEKIDDAGLTLKNQQDMVGILNWNQVKSLAVGRIRIVPPGTTKPEKDFLITDLLTKALPGQQPSVYRLHSQQLNLKKLFPEERNAMQAFKKMIEAILEKTFASCFPGREQCTGPGFLVFPSLNQYDEQLKAKIGSHEI